MKLLRLSFFLLLILLVSAVSWKVYKKIEAENHSSLKDQNKNALVPVIVAPIKKEPFIIKRTFYGSLEANSEFVSSAKTGGKIKSILPELGDPVKRGQLIAILDSDEFKQAILQAEADMKVARANLTQAKSQLIISERELSRIEKLNKQGVSSESQRDIALAQKLTSQAQLEVRKAELARANAQLETQRIKLGYTSVLADWDDEDEQRFVAERFVDDGETVNSNTPLLRIVQINPVNAIIYVTEKAYNRLEKDLQVFLTTDAYPDKTFSGSIKRISPVFVKNSRQARVEIQVDNADLLLKPGMFVRIEIILDTINNATIIPQRALSKRADKEGIFILSDNTDKVLWKTVKTGHYQDEIVQILDDSLQGQVVIMGQQSLKDGSSVYITEQSF